GEREVEVRGEVDDHRGRFRVERREALERADDPYPERPAGQGQRHDLADLRVTAREEALADDRRRHPREIVLARPQEELRGRRAAEDLADIEDARPGVTHSAHGAAG